MKNQKSQKWDSEKLIKEMTEFLIGGLKQRTKKKMKKRHGNLMKMYQLTMSKKQKLKRAQIHLNLEMKTEVRERNLKQGMRRKIENSKLKKTKKQVMG
ncbi:hypothetical protein AMTR_s00065p00188530 [Amborella trichopoda]|uniref:Uncharacterized protein n=1 Tax=Amborella trichopoda TaxID=13333 RepID=U5DE23_AMBTC|nr:hypothetical protein AMTR_s00065p00188530 [Amborella trichopoda]